MSSDSPKTQQMVQKWVLDKGIQNERVKQAMESVPRHLFVPESLRPHAYGESALPIGYDQTISQPYIVALMTQAILNFNPQTQRVLEIGTGSGYQAAVLAACEVSVFSIERIRSLSLSARARLDQLGYYKVSVKYGDGKWGWDEYGPYDAIIVTAASKEFPQSLVSQLKDKACVVIPIEDAHGQQKLYVYQRYKGDASFSRTFLCDCRFVPFV